MNLLFITPSFYPATYYGGPIYSTYELAKAIKKQDVDIKVITTNANGSERLQIKTGVFHKLENELPVKYFKSIDSRGTSLSMLFNLSKEIKKTDVVYLISIFSPPTPFVIHLSKRFDKPLIISPRGQLGKWCLEQGSPFKKLWLRLFIQPLISRLSWHLTSEEEQRNLKTVYPSAKTFVIPNGIDLKDFENCGLRKDKLFYKKYCDSVNEYSKIIISSGRLHSVKGFDILIEAMHLIRDGAQGIEQRADAVLFIAGKDFGEKSNLFNLISLNNLSDKVFLVGHIEGEEKINFLKNADVFALPSHNENFGIVYAEALAAGTPVVASKYTPWRDVEKHNCGKWSENTPEKFAKSILEILQSDNVQMGLNGRKYVEENYSWEKIGREFKVQTENIITVNK